MKSLRNLLSEIVLSKSRNANFLLTSLGIPYLGSTMAEKLLKTYKTIDAITLASKEELSTIEGFSAIRANAIYQYFNNNDNRQMLNELKKLGLNFKYHISQNITYSSLTGSRLAFTGKLAKARSYYAELLQQHGAVIANSISSRTNYLVLGTNPGSKLSAAQELKTVKIITEKQLLNLLNVKE